MAFGIASQESVNSQWTASQDSVASLGPTSQERGNAAAREHAAWEALGELKDWDSDGDNAYMQQASEILSRILSAGRPEEVSAAITSLQIRPDRHVASPEALSALLCPLLEARTSREENCARLVENTLLVHILVLKSAPPRALQACLEATIRARPRAVANGVTGSFLGRVLAGTHAPPAGELRPQLQLVGLALKAVSKASPDAVSEALEFGLATESNTTSKLSASAASVLQLFVNLRPALSESAVSRLLELLTARAHELSTEIAADPSKVSSCKDELNKYTTLVFATASKLGSQLLSSPLLASLERAVVDPNLKGNMIGPARKQLSSLLRKRAK
ncbi:Hypothetical Protein FCC1311_006472 [Hondaea fermentalgiana]|uniref:Uncharacterized protein n=1 Tax=Hondaea fermentalgiana TaxID=2315210 RepID=A0A2R5G287_9STRA|nr:Hypothetical Protein FCC1311_006472 [Hondaea fermentalgiana]|eukprot:GBG24429.1 Hypothetical Protein FCC1311_006472 [Hondaea fermentalgiana]